MTLGFGGMPKKYPVLSMINKTSFQNYCIFAFAMNHSTENKGYFLHTIILMVVVGFLFFFKGDKLPCHHGPHFCYSTNELKASSQGVAAAAIEMPACHKISMNVQHNNPVLRTSFEISLNCSITNNLVQSISNYHRAKPFIDKRFTQQLRPRYPDPEITHLS